MSSTMVTTRSCNLTSGKDSLSTPIKWDPLTRASKKKTFQVIRKRKSSQEIRPSFSARIGQNRDIGPGRPPLRFGVKPPDPPPPVELECPFSAIVLESDTSSSPAELYGDTPHWAWERPASCPIIPPVIFAKIGSTPTPPEDNNSRVTEPPEDVRSFLESVSGPARGQRESSVPPPKNSIDRATEYTEDVHSSPENTHSLARSRRESSVPLAAPRPRSVSWQVPTSYKLSTPPPPVRKSILKSPSNLKYSSPPVEDSPAFSASSYPKTPEPPKITRFSSDRPAPDPRELPYTLQQTYTSCGQKLSSSFRHLYQSYQRQLDPNFLPEPRNFLRLPNRLPPGKPQYEMESTSDPTWLFTTLTEDLPENRAPEERIYQRRRRDEEEYLALLREKEAKRRSMVPFIEYYDVLKETEEIAVVFNVRTRQFRKEKKSTVLERCYRSEDYRERRGRSTNFQNECATALVDDMVFSIPLPKGENSVSIPWLDIIADGIKYREIEVTLPGWLLAARAIGKIDEFFIEKRAR